MRLWTLAAFVFALLPGCASESQSPVTWVPHADAQDSPDGPDSETGDSSVPPNCVPRTCAQEQATCGKIPDGCGSVANCGTCVQPALCGGGGPNQCGIQPCIANPCLAGLAECGPISDGCGEILQCGTCASGYRCELHAPANHCVADVDAGSDAGSCPSGTKGCGAACVKVDQPEFGCAQLTCNPCAVPHATAHCATSACAVSVCDDSFVDCNGNAQDGCETPISALVAIDRTAIVTSATAYGCCDGNRCSCNAVDGKPETTWGSWECAEGNQLCTFGLTFPKGRLARMVLHQPASAATLEVRFGDAMVYAGPGGGLMDVRGSSPGEVNGATIHETAFPSGGLWWEISEVELYRCP